MIKNLPLYPSLAQLRGYSSWNHYSQRDSIMGGPENISSFLKSSWDSLVPGLERDFALLGGVKMRGVNPHRALKDAVEREERAERERKLLGRGTTKEGIVNQALREADEEKALALKKNEALFPIDKETRQLLDKDALSPEKFFVEAWDLG